MRADGGRQELNALPPLKSVLLVKGKATIGILESRVFISVWTFPSIKSRLRME